MCLLPYPLGLLPGQEAGGVEDDRLGDGAGGDKDHGAEDEAEEGLEEEERKYQLSQMELSSVAKLSPRRLAYLCYYSI